jgi:hypothetical protein
MNNLTAPATASPTSANWASVAPVDRPAWISASDLNDVHADALVIDAMIGPRRVGTVWTDATTEARVVLGVRVYEVHTTAGRGWTAWTITEMTTGGRIVTHSTMWACNRFAIVRVR